MVLELKDAVIRLNVAQSLKVIIHFENLQGVLISEVKDYLGTIKRLKR